MIDYSIAIRCALMYSLKLTKKKIQLLWGKFIQHFKSSVMAPVIYIVLVSYCTLYMLCIFAVKRRYFGQ